MSYEELDRVSVIERMIEKRLSQREVAAMLGLTTRQVRRLRQAYVRDGPSGLASKHRGRPSNRQLPFALRDETLAIVRSRYEEDLDFPVSWVNRKRLWLLPYAVHLVIALAIALPTGMWVLAGAYYFGIMSHPVEGWMVNTLGHAFGGRNFETSDNSRNNHLAAWLVFGEGFQNNHHRYATSAKFSYQWWEVDLGYGFCLLLEKFGVLEIRRETLIPSPATVVAEPISDSLAPHQAA